MTDEITTKIALFKGKEVRKTLKNGEWWFAVNDVIEALIDSRDPAQYFKRLKERDPELAKLTDKGGGTICTTPYAEYQNAGRVAKSLLLAYGGHISPYSVNSIS